MYAYTSAGYFDYERQDPPTHYDKIMSACFHRGMDACTSFNALKKRPPNPYQRRDFALAWECGFDTAYERVMNALEEMDDAGRAALGGDEA